MAGTCGLLTLRLTVFCNERNGFLLLGDSIQCLAIVTAQVLFLLAQRSIAMVFRLTGPLLTSYLHVVLLPNGSHK